MHICILRKPTSSSHKIVVFNDWCTVFIIDQNIVSCTSAQWHLETEVSCPIEFILWQLACNKYSSYIEGGSINICVILVFETWIICYITDFNLLRQFIIEVEPAFGCLHHVEIGSLLTWRNHTASIVKASLRKDLLHFSWHCWCFRGPYFLIIFK